MHPTRTRLTSLVAGVLGAAALTALPGATGLTSASADTGDVAYTCDITMSGGFAAYGGEKAATVTFATDAPATIEEGGSITPSLDMSLTLDPAFASAFGPSPVRWIKAELTGATTTGATAGTVTLNTATWDRGGGAGTAMPALTLTATAPWGAVEPTVPGDLDLGVGTLAGHLMMATTYGGANAFTSYPMTCTPDGDDPVVDTVEVTEHVYGYSCSVDLTVSGYGGKSDYPADLDFAIDAPGTAYVGQPFDATVDATLTFGDAFVSYIQNSPVKAISGVADAGEAGVTFPDWNRVLGAGSPIGQPVDSIVLEGTGTWAGITPSAVGDLPLEVEGLDGDLTLTVVYGNATALAPLVCTPEDGTEPGHTSVAVVEPAAMGTPVAPAVAGTRKVGSVLTVSTGTWTPADVALSYRWLRNGTPIAGATGTSYTTVPGDLGSTLAAQVVAAKAGYATTTATAAAGRIAAGTQKVVGTVKVSGTPKVGKKLTARPGSAAGAKVAYQWLVNGKAVAKAGAATMRLTKAQQGRKVAVRVTYTRAGYAAVVQTSPALKVKK